MVIREGRQRGDYIVTRISTFYVFQDYKYQGSMSEICPEGLHAQILGLVQASLSTRTAGAFTFYTVTLVLCPMVNVYTNITLSNIIFFTIVENILFSNC